MTDFEWNPDTYLDEMHDEIPGYEELQDAVAAAIPGGKRFLELGVGTGETALRVLERFPEAIWVGVDASEPMLARARVRLHGADLRSGRLEDPLPEGPFDAVVSVLAVHHLRADAKRDLFARIAASLRPRGVFVLGDLVVPRPGDEGPIFVDWEMDVPDSAADQVRWLGEAGFEPSAEHVRADLAVIVAELGDRPLRTAVDESPASREETGTDT